MTSITALVENSESFHPISKVSLTLPLSDLSASNCLLNLVYNLPPSLFVDRYELTQRHESYTAFVWGETDLEKPVHAVENSYTQMVISITPPEGPTSSQLDVEVPLHARYGVPSSIEKESTDSGAYHKIFFDWPKAFLSCPKNASLPIPIYYRLLEPPTYLSESRIREIHIDTSLSSLSPRMTSFWHVPVPSDLYAEPQTHSVRIPIGHENDTSSVQAGTTIVMVLAFIWLSFVSIRTATRLARVPVKRD